MQLTNDLTGSWGMHTVGSKADEGNLGQSAGAQVTHDANHRVQNTIKYQS